MIGAYDPATAPGGLRGLLPLAGTPLIEHQARRAVAAGAQRVLLLVDVIPPELLEVLERLRADGIGTALVEGIDRVAEALMPADRLLLLSDACLPDEALLRETLAQPACTVAILADVPEHAMFERIDADTRWAGLALVNGAHVAETAAMLGSWDPISTLLRRAVQQDAGRLVAAHPPILATDPSSLADAERQMVAATRSLPGDWIGRALFLPLEEIFVPLLLARRVEARPLALAAMAMALGGAGIAWAGWRWAALLLLLLAGPMAAITRRLARVRDRRGPVLDAVAVVRPVAATVAIAGLAYMLWSIDRQWGWWVIAALVPAAMLLRLPGRSRPWLASGDGLIWTLLPFALAGQWGWGLAASAAYSLASFLFVQGDVLRRIAADEA
ncbi:hypothetical protein [uncultured Sphingomonas sp.]|uniref:hypothetical protein n=1 Tax=uncultured Sphingomonas sp. TaxID=158754 RepID=UPI0025DD131A|nr:hypothetical protein [uncultured Sphingomonas sp.]